MTDAPPKQPLIFTDRGTRVDAAAVAAPDGSDAATLSGRADGRGIEADPSGRFGRLKQNLTNHWRVRDRRI